MHPEWPDHKIHDLAIALAKRLRPLSGYSVHVRIISGLWAATPARLIPPRLIGVPEKSPAIYVHDDRGQLLVRSELLDGGWSLGDGMWRPTPEQLENWLFNLVLVQLDVRTAAADREALRCREHRAALTGRQDIDRIVTLTVTLTSARLPGLVVEPYRVEDGVVVSLPVGDTRDGHSILAGAYRDGADAGSLFVAGQVVRNGEGREEVQDLQCATVEDTVEALVAVARWELAETLRRYREVLAALDPIAATLADVVRGEQGRAP